MVSNQKLGRIIVTQVFEGNPYAELSQLRDVVWAQDVLLDFEKKDKADYENRIIDLENSVFGAEKSHVTYEMTYTQEDLDKAKVIMDNARTIDTKIQSFKQ